jgi:aminopeptidase 2
LFCSEAQGVDSYQHHIKEEVLDIKLAKELTSGSKVTLTIDFIGFINDKMAGFYRSSYVDSDSGTKK